MRTVPRLDLARATLSLALLLTGAAPLSAQLERPLLDTPPLSPEARLLLDLHGGDYQISTSDDSKIHVVESRTEKNQSVRATSISFQKTSAGARLEIEPVSNNSPHITINLPACAALELRLTAGELVLDAAPCQSTTVSMHAGDLRARMSDPDIFRSLRASVSIGQIDAPGLGPGERDSDAGGFFRSFKRSGSGSRTFAAHVGTGQITLDGRKQ